ncbi:MAG: VanR-ABDEGLN family response regulator transcription factor [Faecalibacterium sp.]|nr:VanR-ABDEGLN family response regulator transcription factor [Ruminococcus sp.]MCM1486152.1 VanR-ABDEGLN family response regulator transcription factor [Faecalibacterium sp.]
MSMKILIVDDEKEIADLIELFLKSEDYDICKCFNGKDALEKINSVEFDLAVLDVMLPDVDGFELCSAIRAKYTYPVIMLTARTEDIDKISGLTLGADDYVTKPFNPLELTARIKAQLRRYKQYSNDSADNTKNDSIIEISGLEVDSRTHKCYLFGNEVFLTPTEFGILWILCENAGNVVSTEDIFEKVWGEKYLDSNNTVMVHIRRIREKLHEPSRNPRFVKTVWGVGYKIEKKS